MSEEKPKPKIACLSCERLFEPDPNTLSSECHSCRRAQVVVDLANQEPQTNHIMMHVIQAGPTPHDFSLFCDAMLKRGFELVTVGDSHGVFRRVPVEFKLVGSESGTVIE